ncbi:MAG: hypothetical protein VYC00_01420 [Candidatus Neomarinimicrobiota bacterium]|nr:hypothetical protein [Candidatus Neomarinimicrobiota bacterium]
MRFQNQSIAILLIAFCILLGQGKEYQGPEDPAGDIAAEKEGYMTGNRVFIYFRNTTELSDWPRVNVSKWPNNPDGLKMTDGIGLLVGAKVYIEDDGDGATVDTIPLTELADIYTKDHHTLYYLQTSYREEMDINPLGTVEWGFYPVFGYFNETGEYPALSNIESSWPIGGWPSTGFETKWPGEWNGRFGRGVIYADQETYYVVNDAQDQENLGPEDNVRYFPRPGHYVGDLKPDVTIQPGVPWGGLGLRVAVRGFQWNNPQARDAIFWEYSIANVSDYDLRDVAFGYWLDNSIGGDGDDDLGHFDKQVDMAYSWDVNGVGAGGLPTGVMGFAYLESPGLAYDYIDNDNDGLVDEKRDYPGPDDPPMSFVGPTDGITDLNAFLEFYKLNSDDLRDHWDADEDQDWDDGEDLDGDGIYQLSEYAGDDIGIDGVAPGELNYNGPDLDGSECNHQPDFQEGVGCEPNFNTTDVSESDMVGLTAFRMFPIPSHAPSNETNWFKNDQAMWEVIGTDSMDENVSLTSNLVEVFASGPFPLYQGRVERISMSELHSYDPLAGLESDDHSAPALFELKRIVQIIYEKDYRFAQPPKMPTLTATAGDGEVILTWDDIADTKTRDPFVGNINDFEGYKVYRSTDKYLSDPEIITDGYGTPMFKKPIYQCDLTDQSPHNPNPINEMTHQCQGFTDFGLVNGMGYNLGTNSGISHIFVDNTVQNGRTYYYAVIAYDFGAPDIGPGISPSENNAVIELDEAEEVRTIGKNVAIVIPHQRAAGYIPPTLETEESDLLGSGTVTPLIRAQGSLNPDHSYFMTFGVDTIDDVSDYDHGFQYVTNEVFIYDDTDSTILVYKEDTTKYVGTNLIYRDTVDYWTLNPGGTIFTDIFDGMQVEIDSIVETPEYNYQASGWINGNGIMRITPNSVKGPLVAWKYNIVFTDNDSAFVGMSDPRRVRDENDQTERDIITNPAVSFFIQNTSFIDTSTGEFELMDVVVHDVNDNDTIDIFEDRFFVGGSNWEDSEYEWRVTAFVIDFQLATEATYPNSGDVYQVDWKRPFYESDTIRFSVSGDDNLDRSAIASDMNSIKVVPNPYVMTNMMEPAVSNPFLNQRRRLMFTHIPADCIIKIFTVSGVLVDEIIVDNEPENGIIHWDMLTRENLEIAAGMYLYHIEAQETGDEKLGKFAVIK